MEALWKALSHCLTLTYDTLDCMCSHTCMFIKVLGRNICTVEKMDDTLSKLYVTIKNNFIYRRVILRRPHTDKTDWTKHWKFTQLVKNTLWRRFQLTKHVEMMCGMMVCMWLLWLQIYFMKLRQNSIVKSILFQRCLN